MLCRVMELRCKEVVNVCDGGCLGCVSDVEVDTETARVVSIVIYGRPKFFGLLGREEDTVIGWECIECIGEDTVLVRFEDPHPHPRRTRSFLDGLLG